MEKRSSGILHFITFIVGILFGGIAALFLSTDEKGETKKEVKRKVANVKTKIKETTETDRIKDIYGSLSSEARKKYAEARKVMDKKVAQFQKTFETIDKDKYREAVADVTAQLKKESAVTAQQLTKLKDYFMEDYQKFAEGSKKTPVKRQQKKV